VVRVVFVTGDLISDIDWAGFSKTHAELGGGFVRVFGYFQDDGEKAIVAIEEAVRGNSATAIVLPAHKLKSEARQFGATALANLAEHIEFQARDCIEWRTEPSALVEQVVTLRPLFIATIEALDAACNPLMQRRTPAGIGRAA
jgi:histidine phosphotransfer protein HptB